MTNEKTKNEIKEEYAKILMNMINSFKDKNMQKLQEAEQEFLKTEFKINKLEKQVSEFAEEDFSPKTKKGEYLC